MNAGETGVLGTADRGNRFRYTLQISTINAMLVERTALRLRPPQVADEQVARRAQDELAADGFDFAWWPPGEQWADRVAWFADAEAGRNLPPNGIPNAFRFAEVNGNVVGRTSVRFALNDVLLAQGGHIGYAVRPAFRRRCHATTILLRSIELGRAAGLGSRTVIERCGGVLDPDWPHHQTTSGIVVSRYWIPEPVRSA